MTVRPLLAALPVLAGLVLPRLAAAHEATMAMLVLRELRPNQFVGTWTLTPTFDPARLHVRVPANCVWDPPTLACDEHGLVGTIRFDDLGQRMSVVMVRVDPLQGEAQNYVLTPAHPEITVVGAAAMTWRSWRELADTYVNLGIDHILLGIDHLLFVFGLIWLVRSRWALAKTITAFTVGHSISLAAATFGLVGVPERPLNATIALSIVFLGVEIARARKGRPGLAARFPWAVAGAFGLLHGLGFASALVSLGLSRALLPMALLSFNVGVEIGQFAFVLVVLALLWAHRTARAVPPAWTGVLPAYAIGVVAMFWFLGRMHVLLTAPNFS